MRDLLIVLAIVAAIAIFWYLWRKSAAAAEQRRINNSQRVGQPGTGAGELAEGSATTRPGLLQDAASSAAGLPYARAADRMEELTSEIATARREADREAERLANQAAEAIAAVQAAAASHGGAVPGDGTDRCPPDCPVKGDMTAKAYLLPDDPAYHWTVPDVCFQNVAAAEAAGFGKSGIDVRTGIDANAEDRA